MSCTHTINSCQHTVNTHSNINKSLKLESNLSNITLYHGSPNTELTQLDIAKSYGSGDQYGRGLYLTTDYDEADGYAKGGRVYKVQLDDSLKFFNMEDKLPKGIVDFLYNELKDSDDDFRNSILRYARKIYKNDDMDSLEKFYDEKEEEWKSKDGYYSANKPEVDRDDKGDLIVIYTDYNDLKNSLEQLTGNMTLRAFGGDLNPQLFGNWIMSEGYDGIITHSGKWYILYKHPEKAKIVENLQKEESNFRAFKFINHKKTQVDEGNNRQELEDKYEGSEIFVDENDDISKMCESNQYPLDVKDIKNLNQWFRDNIDKEPDEDWRNRLKDAYDCSYTQIFKGSPLKRKREIVQQYLDYKNKIEESKKSDDLYYTIYNHAKKLIELNPNIEPDKLNMSNTYLTDDLETIRTYNEVLKKIDSLTKYLDTDIKLGVISEEKAQYKRDIAGIMKRYVDMRINTIKGIKTESTHKLEEASRNELLALAKSETITRYNKSAGYKGFYLVDIDTTAIKTRDALIITNKVGKYYDTIELEDILYWIGLEVDNSRDKKATVENVRKALRGAMDGMDIKVDCSCPDFCLEENTLIKLLNGEVISVKDMKDRFDNNEELWVYSTDEKGDFKPGKVTNVWISGYKDEMIKITLDNGREIITTPNHRYMMRDGSYKRADELKEKDSLMPLYFNYHNGYEAVKSNSEKVTTYHSVYKLVADELLQDKKEEARQRTGEDIIQIHHKDFNKLNNYPSNLNPMGRLEHWHYHASLGKEHIGKFIEAGREFWKSDPRRFKAAEKQKRKAREYQINMWSNFTPEEREEYINKSRQAINRDKLSSALKDVWSSYSLEDRNKRLETNSFITNNPMTNEEFRNSEAFVIRNNNISKSLKEFHKNTTAEQRSKLYGWSKGKKFSDEHRNRISESLKGKKHTEEYKENMSKKQKEIAPRLKQSRCFRNIRELIEQKKDITPENFLANRRGGDTHYLNVFDSFEDMVSTFYNTQQYNHKVAKVEVIHYDNAIPVYDIEVEKYHNFYVDAGVMLHNCYRFAYQATVLGYKYGKPETREAKITNPHNYGSACKHIIAMLSNKQWIEQVASTVTDWVVENVEWVREFLQVTEDEFKVPDEYARYIGKHGAMKKAWDKIPDKDTEKEEQEQDQEMDQEEQPEEDIQDEIPEENNAENQESDEELEEK